MDLKLDKEKKEPLLSRVRVVGSVEFSGPTPKNDDLAGKIADMKKVDKGVIAIRKIANVYGLNKASVEAYIYESEDAKKRIESKKEKKDGKTE